MTQYTELNRKQHQEDIPEDLFNYFQDVLRGVTEHLKQRIQAALDQPDQPEAPIAHFLHIEHNGRRGRPRIAVDPEFLSTALQLRPASQIGPELFNVSTRTITRRATELGLREQQPPVFAMVPDERGVNRQIRLHAPAQPPVISDEDLDVHVGQLLSLFPNSGRKMLLGLLKSIGVKVTRRQVEASFNRVNGPRAEFAHRRIERRIYKVPGPNSLWHHDGNHSEYRLTII
jgi:hypothetical protein